MQFPVFIYSFNRTDIMKTCINSIKNLDHVGDIIIRDNGSTNQETLDILADYAREGIKVNYAEPIGVPDHLNRMNEDLDSFFGGVPSSPYVVTDPDIDMSVARRDSLAVYHEILETDNRKAEVVGPVLRIRDVPTDYPLYNSLMNAEGGRFQAGYPVPVTLKSGKKIFLRASPIDTTFGMRRAGVPFKRPGHGFRVYEPFECRHLDWYRRGYTEDVYTQTANRVTTWGHENLDAETCHVEGINIVRIGQDGHPHVDRHIIAPKDPAMDRENKRRLEEFFIRRSGANMRARFAGRTEKVIKKHEARLAQIERKKDANRKLIQDRFKTP